MSEVRAFVEMVLRHLLRDRSALFFMLALPVVIIVIIGSTFGTDPPIRVGVVGGDSGEIARGVVDDLDAAAGLEVRTYDSIDELRRAVRRFEIAAGVDLPDGLDNEVAAGRTASVTVIGDLTSISAAAARSSVEGAVDDGGTRAAAVDLVAGLAGVSSADAASALDGVDVEAVGVRTDDVREAVVGDLSPFALTAPQNLVLFVFINTLGAGTLIVRARRSGVLRRVIATPTSTTRIIVGLGAGWMAVALVQSAIILLVGRIGFGVRWGDPLGAAALVVVFASVGAASGLLLGAIGRNEDRVGAMTPVFGLVLGALGGCMVPFEVFPPVMQTIARVTPHYWAMQGWTTLVFDGGDLADVAGDLGALAAFALLLGGSAVALLRRDLTGASPHHPSPLPASSPPTSSTPPASA